MRDLILIICNPFIFHVRIGGGMVGVLDSSADDCVIIEQIFSYHDEKKLYFDEMMMLVSTLY